MTFHSYNNNFFLGECKINDKLEVTNKQGCIEIEGIIGIKKILVWDYQTTSLTLSWRNITNLINQITINGSSLVS